MVDRIGKPFFGGIPTGPEIQKLWDALGAPGPGVIPHERFEEVLGIDRKNGRYRQIVNGWRRKLLKERNIDTQAEVAVGIRVLTEPERVHVSCGDLMTATRRVRKATLRAQPIREAELDEVDRVKLNHIRLAGSKMFAATSTSARDLSRLLKAPEQQPKVER